MGTGDPSVLKHTVPLALMTKAFLVSLLLHLDFGVGSYSLRRGVIEVLQPLALGPLPTPMGGLILLQPSPPLQTMPPDVLRTSAHEVPQAPDPGCPK